MKITITPHVGGISDFEDGGFYGLCSDFDQKKENPGRIKKGNEL